MMLFGTTMVITPAMADSVTFHFQGSVDTIGGNILGGTSPFGSNGNPEAAASPIILSGSYTFTGPDGPSPSLTAFYFDTITNLTFNLHHNYLNPPSPAADYNNIPGTVAPINVTSVFNTDLVTGIDRYTVAMSFSGDPVNGQAASRFELDFGSVLNPWNDNSLPMTPPTLNSISAPMRFAVIFAGGESSTLRGNISSLALVATPLPPAVILFGAGLVALIGLGARNWQRARA